jgi:TetR/AcrR family transcriptional regulator, transcriptional repressor for nem operon
MWSPGPAPGGVETMKLDAGMPPYLMPSNSEAVGLVRSDSISICCGSFTRRDDIGQAENLRKVAAGSPAASRRLATIAVPGILLVSLPEGLTRSNTVVHIVLMARPSHRERLLDHGLATVRERGFGGASVRDITQAAGVPQGSFTNHFPSKEAFGVEIVERYFADVRALMAATLEDPDRPPLVRLHAYFDAITDRFRARDFRHGCLVGNMTLETVEGSAVLQAKLAEIFDQWREPFARCLAEAEAARQVHLPLPPLEFADFLLASWQGAILRMKVERSEAPLERFKQIVFTWIREE